MLSRYSAERRRAALLPLVSLAVLVALAALSLSVGALGVPLGQVWSTLLGDAPSTRVENVVWSVRVPRTALGIAAGAALGLAGTLMQALTRNPLADPGLLGVSAGAAFAIVLAVGVLGLGSVHGYIWFAFAGAFAASVLVHILGGLGRSGSTPVQLALAGVAVTALLTSLTSAIALTDPDALNRFRFWSAGTLANQDQGTLNRVLPFLAVGALIALALGPALNRLALGDDVATSLGLRTGRLRLAGVSAVTLLTGAAVAAIGPIVFVGLIVPHIARSLTQYAGIGPDHRWLLPLSALIAPSLLLAADIAGRLLARPAEIQAGVLVALIGGPFFIVMVRRRRLAEL
ncbi:FecCD family ABC transporter permease [Streptomyces yaizuensis]|uniref:Iron ABC transporter permease n=1 Tax=Streptomyces yaizuensis TaxID=2989713 RepID=A0ABQ5P2T8_9ACTN|nr:iron chelate uptake ABC transporter family permease subunit [Streptomyces sp. YSPA8]GLF96914.1 iron ABC transporter permease [Streptomyces sp. YSPA8]